MAGILSGHQAELRFWAEIHHQCEDFGHDVQKQSGKKTTGASLLSCLFQGAPNLYMDFEKCSMQL